MPQGVAHRQKIERVVRKWQRFGATLDEGRGKFLSRHAEHAFARIEAGDIFSRPEYFRRLNGHEDGPTRDVEHVHARFQAMTLLDPAAVVRSAAQEAPVDYAIIMFRAGIEEPVY